MTPHTQNEWETGLQFEVLEDYLLEAKYIPVSDADYVAHLKRMRSHFEKLKTFIRQELTATRKEAVDECFEVVVKEIMNPNVDRITSIENVRKVLKLLTND